MRIWILIHHLANTNTISSESVVSLTSFVAEQKERQVLHNIPASTVSDSSIIKQEDIAKIDGILFNEYIDGKPTINNATWLEKKDTNKCHLPVGSTQEKITVLRNKLKLREESNPSYIKKIFINPDYTPLEQKE